MQIFRGSAPDPTGGVYSAPPDPLTDGEGAHRSHPKNPTPALGPLGLVFYRSQGLTYYRVSNPTNDRFHLCRPIYEARIFFGFGEWRKWAQ